MFGPINAKGAANINLQRKRIALYDSLQRDAFTLQLLMDFEGAVVTDSSPHAHGIVATGSVATSTTRFKFGAKSLALTGGYLTATSSDLVISTQDFTVDCWVYFTSLGTQTFVIDTRTGSGTTNGFSLYQTSGKIVYYDGSTALITASTIIAINTWHHVEVGRSGSTVYLFVDGVLQGTAADGNSKSSNNWIIGAGQYFPVGVSPMAGSQDEFRALIGKCAHTVSFSPPTVPY